MIARGERWATMRHAAPSLLLAAVVGIAPARASDDAVRRDMQVAASWAAMAAYAGEGWRDARLPKAYVARTLDQAGTTLDRTQETLAKDIAGTIGHGDPQSAVALARDRTGRLAGAIDRGDGVTVAALIAELRRVSRQLQTVP